MAQILRFPRRPLAAQLPAGVAVDSARKYLDTPIDARSDRHQSLLGNPDFLVALCGLLRERAESSPSTVAEESAALYQWISDSSAPLGLFDERDYFLGEAALLVGRTLRHLGERDEAELWLDRSEASFRHIVNSGPLLANVSYARLTLRYEERRFQEVAELVPSLIKSFDRLGMKLESAKARFLNAVSLKQCERSSEAVGILDELRQDQAVANEPALLGQVLVEIGEHLSVEERYVEATSCYRQAVPLIKQSNRPLALASLKVSLAETFRRQELLDHALEGYRSALADFAELGMSTYVAYLHVLVSETLISCGRHREAEWEILAALPTIEEQKMVPEGFAAVALLKESVRRRKTDPNALRELREHLQASK